MLSDDGNCDVFYERSKSVGKYVNDTLQLESVVNANRSEQNMLDSVISNYGVYYGSNRIISFCKNNQSGEYVPAPDFAAFLPISRDNAAKSYSEYTRYIRLVLKKYRKNGDVVTMAVNSLSRAVIYYNEKPCDDYFDCLFNWSTKCSAKFTLCCDDSPFSSIITPSLRQIAACAFGSDTDSGASDDDTLIGDACVRLVSSIMSRAPVPCDITEALEARLGGTGGVSGGYDKLRSVCAAVYKYNESL